MPYIDLTQTFTAATPVYPGDPKPELTQRGVLERDGFSDWRLSTGMHTGTHIDGPLHMIAGGRSLETFDPGRFFGAGVVIDARGCLEISSELCQQTKISPARIVIFCTGWSARYGQANYYHEYPILTVGAAEYLVSQGVEMVGFDSPSPDQPPFLVHKILLGNDVLIIENLTNVEALINVPAFELAALPIKVAADSALARVIARVL